MKNVMMACKMAALLLQIWFLENHPQCKQHHQEDRSQEDKRDIEKGLATGMER
jgi:hypothetical protein